ncbi:MAG: SCO family protein [bacterium]|nr:SCO family protein [bacterium]MBK9305096.1 SCO family protein [bacterium]
MARRGIAATCAAAALVAALAADASPSLAQGGPADLTVADIVERPGAQLPLDLVFAGEDSAAVRLGDCFAPGRPVILNLGYFACPMLCGLVLNGMVDGLRDVAWTPGAEFGIVTLSIDAREGPRLAGLKKGNALASYGRPEAAAGWRFLTGGEAEIRAVTEAVGFGFAWDEKTQQWMHPAALVVCTPDGRVSRYLYGVEFDAQTLRLALAEASGGRIGGTTEKLLLLCYDYDSSVGRYGPSARRLMTVAGYVTVLAIAGWLALLWRRERRRKST